jgi:hypothetical protein
MRLAHAFPDFRSLKLHGILRLRSASQQGAPLRSGLQTLHYVEQNGSDNTEAESYSDLGAAIAVNSFPSLARGNSNAFNSAPTNTTRDTMYIQTSSAMPAPSDP